MDGLIVETRDTTPQLVKRPIHPPLRPLIGWADLPLALWLGGGLVLAQLPCRTRLTLCRAMAKLARTRRARDARSRAMRIGRRSVAEAQRIIDEVYAGRLAGQLDLLRALSRRCDLETAAHGLHVVEEGLARGHGVVLWVSDLVSASDISKIALARAGYRVKHLSRLEHGFSKSRFGIACLNPMRLAFERGLLDERIVFDRMNPAPAMNRMIECLRGNGIVSIVAGAHEGGTFAEVPFLGGRLRLALGALRLARVTGAPVVPVFVLRDRSRPELFDVTFDAPLPVARSNRGQDDLLAMARVYGTRLEALVRTRPETWGGWRRVGHLTA